MNIESIRQTLPINNFYSNKDNKKYISLPKNKNISYSGRIFDKFSDKNVILNSYFLNSTISKKNNS